MLPSPIVHLRLARKGSLMMEDGVPKARIIDVGAIRVDGLFVGGAKRGEDVGERGG